MFSFVHSLTSNFVIFLLHFAKSTLESIFTILHVLDEVSNL